MSKTRYATFPLDCEADKAADEAVAEAMRRSGPENEPDPYRQLRMDHHDARYRVIWMDAYIKAGGKYKRTKQTPRPGQPITTCEERTQSTCELTIVVIDSLTSKPFLHEFPHVRVEIRAPDGTTHHLTPDPGGIIELPDVTPGPYDIRAARRGYDDATESIILAAECRVVEIALTPVPRPEPASIRPAGDVDPGRPRSEQEYMGISQEAFEHLRANMYPVLSQQAIEEAIELEAGFLRRTKYRTDYEQRLGKDPTRTIYYQPIDSWGLEHQKKTSSLNEKVNHEARGRINKWVRV